MALIVEDGSLVENADSYVNSTTIEAFLNDRGLLSDTLQTQVEREAMALRAMDFLNTQSYIGNRVDDNQSLPFPREGVTLSDNRELSSDTIPKELKDAQCWLIYYIDSGTDPATTQTQLVKREKVDTLEIEYQDAGAFNTINISELPNVSNLLKNLVSNSSGYIARA